MSLNIDALVESAKALYSRLFLWQRIGIAVVVGVFVFVFLGTIGHKESPPRTELSGFKPYRPERALVAKGKIAGLGGQTKKGEFPRPPGPGVEVSILEEIRSLKGQIEELRSTVMNMSESAEEPPNDKVLAAISGVRDGLQTVSSELTAIRERMQRDEQLPKEQSPIELLATVSASGFKYAMLRTEAGDKRVTEGDRVGPWMVVRIEGQEVSLESSHERRILRVE